MIKYVVSVFVLCTFIFACQPATNSTSANSFESDLEKVATVDGEQFFETTDQQLRISNAHLACSDFARTGKQCVRLDSLNPYGLNFTVVDLRPGEFLEVSVWVKEGDLTGGIQAMLKGDDRKYRWRTYYNPKQNPVDGWVKQELSFVVRPGIKQVDFYVLSGGHVAHFDDLTFRRSSQVPENNLPVGLSLTMTDSARNKFDDYVSKAGYLGIIPAQFKSYVPASLVAEGDTGKVKMKLKGDWADHIHSGKASFRVKITDEIAFCGLKSFSVQHPKCRNYLDEWVFHKMADQEDVLTTHYDFINVEVDKVNYGVYALEEHFDKQLLERRNRREGPILKLDETGMWSVIKYQKEENLMEQFPYFEGSAVSVFKKNRTKKSTSLRKQFDEGQRLLTLFKEGGLKVDDLFDVDRLARYYVLMDLCQGGHGLKWHNRRFYFNPITQKLEHIAYDVLPFSYGNSPQNYMLGRLEGKWESMVDQFDYAILQSELFKEKYLFYLKEKTKPEYLDALFESLQVEMERNLKAIQTESSDYVFEPQKYYDQAACLRKGIPVLEANWNKYLTDNATAAQVYGQKKYEAIDSNIFLHDLSVNTFYSKKGELHELIVENYHRGAIRIEGYQSKGNGAVKLASPRMLERFDQNADSVHILLPVKPRKIYFTALNSPGTVRAKKVTPWAYPDEKTSRLSLEESFGTRSALYQVHGNEIVFSGSTVVDTLLYFPKGFDVKLEPGTQLEFRNGGGLIVNGSFSAISLNEQPIRIFCTDSTSNGLTILKGEKVVFNGVEITGLSNLKSGNWELPGAVNIYETPVEITACKISGTNSEDGLNTVRSHVNIDGLEIADTWGDGWDADFCEGQLKNGLFRQTGNDAIDCSGSKLTLEDIVVVQAGDKAVSGGEASVLHLTNVQVKGAVCGIASKDASVLTGENVRIGAARVACAAFCKKPEYGAASINFANYVNEDNRQEVLTDRGSVIKVNEQEHIGTDKLSVMRLYEWALQ